MKSTSQVQHASFLPEDLWRQVAKHVPFSDKPQLALVSQMFAQACRDGWSEANYFECADQPDKPARLRVAHRPPDAGERRPWLARCRELRGAGPALPAPEDSLQQRRPQRALMALAREATPELPRLEAERWPLYAEALQQARRADEAGPFAALDRQVEAMSAALHAGDSQAVQRLLGHRIPLPSTGHAVAQALAKNPALADLLSAQLLDSGAHAPLEEAFSGSAQARAALLKSRVFREDPRLAKLLFQTAFDMASPDALAEVFHQCTPEQARAWVSVDGEPANIHNVCYWAMRGKLAVQLPHWIAAGGRVQDILEQCQGLPVADIPVLIQHGADPEAAVRHILSQPYRDGPWGWELTDRLQTLLIGGVRLSPAQLDDYKRQNRDAGGFDRVLRALATVDVVPQEGSAHRAASPQRGLRGTLGRWLGR